MEYDKHAEPRMRMRLAFYTNGKVIRLLENTVVHRYKLVRESRAVT